MAEIPETKKIISDLGRGPSEAYIEKEKIREALATLEKYKGPITTEVPKFKPLLENIDLLFKKLQKRQTIAMYNDQPKIFSKNAFVNSLLSNTNSATIKQSIEKIKKNEHLKKALEELNLKTKDLEDIVKSIKLFYKS
jgi:DNA repair exonuclease SbcCD ATPase subunit